MICSQGAFVFVIVERMMWCVVVPLRYRIVKELKETAKLRWPLLVVEEDGKPTSSSSQLTGVVQCCALTNKCSCLRRIHFVFDGILAVFGLSSHSMYSAQDKIWVWYMRNVIQRLTLGLINGVISRVRRQLIRVKVLHVKMQNKPGGVGDTDPPDFWRGEIGCCSAPPCWARKH